MLSSRSPASISKPTRISPSLAPTSNKSASTKKQWALVASPKNSDGMVSKTMFSSLAAPSSTGQPHSHPPSGTKPGRSFHAEQSQTKCPSSRPTSCRLASRTTTSSFFEVTQWDQVPAADRYLLKRINSNTFVVLAEWDVTEVEQAAMRAQTKSPASAGLRIPPATAHATGPSSHSSTIRAPPVDARARRGAQIAAVPRPMPEGGAGRSAFSTACSGAIRAAPFQRSRQRDAVYQATRNPSRAFPTRSAGSRRPHRSLP